MQRNFRQKNFSSKIKEKVLKDNIPILGICLGMQLLASWGNEGSDKNFTEGLNLINGKVVSLKDLGSNLVLPHIGWNNIKIKNQSNLIKNIPMNTDFYFVHSLCLYRNRRKKYHSCCFLWS